MAEETVTTSHGDRIPGKAEFEAERELRRGSLASNGNFRAHAVRLQTEAERHRYMYAWGWLGIPILRVPEYVCMFQELIWRYKPVAIIKTGVGRGGSLVLSASLRRLAGIEMLESGSTSDEARALATGFLDGAERAIIVLDRDHTHEHVLGELRSLTTLLPVCGYVIVADTSIEEFPSGHFANRAWNRGNNPLTAAREFLSEDEGSALAPEWSRRGLLSEFRDGVLQRTA